MKKAPYSLAEAKQLCEQHQLLVGQAFAADNNALIECVTITPFDEVNRKRFLIYYFLFNNADHVLAHEYKGLLYDVLVIARSVSDQHELLQEDIYTWTQENAGAPGNDANSDHLVSSRQNMK